MLREPLCAFFSLVVVIIMSFFFWQGEDISSFIWYVKVRKRGICQGNYMPLHVFLSVSRLPSFHFFSKSLSTFFSPFSSYFSLMYLIFQDKNHRGKGVAAHSGDLANDMFAQPILTIIRQLRPVFGCASVDLFDFFRTWPNHFFACFSIWCLWSSFL